MNQETVSLTEITDQVTVGVPHLLAVRSDGLTFAACVQMASGNADLVSEFDRLRGTNLSLRGAPISLAIDEATGRLDHDMQSFLRFVWNNVFLRCGALA